MNKDLLPMLRCPIQRTPLRLEVLEEQKKQMEAGLVTVVWTGVLYSEGGLVYPIINGVPRLIVEATEDFADFFRHHISDFQSIKMRIDREFGAVIRKASAKNRHTKAAFAQEWGLHQQEDKTWNLNREALFGRFLQEVAETETTIAAKWVLDAGCGNGLLDTEMASKGVFVVGFDFSNSVEVAYARNNQPNAHFVQGDVEFPPFAFETFHIVHSSGVLIHTEKTELSLSALTPCVRPGGSISIWVYRPRKNALHNLFNFVRRLTSRLPVGLQYYLYAGTLLPISYVVKKMKGNRQNAREMMVEILDWFSPQYRWEHEKTEVESWLWKRSFTATRITDENMWGFNVVAKKR